MHIRYPYQNSDAEEDRGINKEMKRRMEIEDYPIWVFKIEKFIVGDLFKIKNKNVSMHPEPQTNCPLCW